jgi:curved DNA-binding protein CbpA
VTAVDDPLDRLDYYSLLEIDETATADAVRRAFHVFAAKYHPDRHAGAPLETRERAAQIYRRGAEAYRVLCDRDQRRLYDEQRTRGRVRFDPEDVPRRGDGRVPSTRPFVARCERRDC